MTGHDARANAREAVENDVLRRALESGDRAAMNRLWRAMMLATDVETCAALLRGEPVPVDRLDAVWVAKLRRPRS